MEIIILGCCSYRGYLLDVKSMDLAGNRSIISSNKVLYFTESMADEIMGNLPISKN